MMERRTDGFYIDEISDFHAIGLRQIILFELGLTSGIAALSLP
jgi:hypothetical protein